MRQMMIIEFTHTHGSIKSGDIMNLYGISRQVAGKELAKLVEQNLIRTNGKGSTTRYVMVLSGCRFGCRYPAGFAPAAIILYRHNAYDVVNAALDQISLKVANIIKRADFPRFPSGIEADE